MHHRYTINSESKNMQPLSIKNKYMSIKRIYGSNGELLRYTVEKEMRVRGVRAYYQHKTKKFVSLLVDVVMIIGLFVAIVAFMAIF